MATSKDVETFLEHSGVLGMKWGHHLAGRTEASHNTKAAKKVHFKDTVANTTTKKKYSVNTASDHVQSRELSAKPNYTLSNSDLKKVNERLQLERTNVQLDPGKISKGYKITLGIIGVAGTAATVYNLTQSPAGKAATSAGKKAVSKIISNL